MVENLTLHFSVVIRTHTKYSTDVVQSVIDAHTYTKTTFKTSYQAMKFRKLLLIQSHTYQSPFCQVLKTNWSKITSQQVQMLYKGL